MLEDLPDPLSVTQLVRCEQRLSAARLVRVANTIGSSGDAAVDRRRARNQLDCSQLSRRTVRRDARRAAALAGNPHLADQMDTAGVEVEAIDALLKATDGQTGAIAVKLIDDVSGLAPDQATQVVEKYLEGSTSPNEVSTEYEQQMVARRVHRYSMGAIGGRPAMEGIGIEAPKALIDRMWSRICARADAKYQSGGGRERRAHEHQPLSHRRFDALLDMVDGSAGGVGGGKPNVVVTVDAGDLFDDPDKTMTAHQLGAGPIPTSLLNRYVTEGAISILINNAEGVPLWYGRARRGASSAQFLALAVRDRGCVLCRASVDRCVAHHIMPWSAPGRGRTDVNQMALLCETCHRDLHHRNHTLVHRPGPSGVRLWSTRSATPKETPIRPPPYRQRE